MKDVVVVIVMVSKIIVLRGSYVNIMLQIRIILNVSQQIVAQDNIGVPKHVRV
jgi:hypothetical protein